LGLSLSSVECVIGMSRRHPRLRLINYTEVGWAAVHDVAAWAVSPGLRFPQSGIHQGGGAGPRCGDDTTGFEPVALISCDIPMNTLITTPTRRNFLLRMAAWVLAARNAISSAQAKLPNRPLVGAIRWDAWYVPGSDPTAALERSLSPPQYQSRLPFFARRDAESHVSLPPLSPRVMDLEIEQAAYAGLDFWAFVGYPSESPMSAALQHYLASSMRWRIRFCMFTQMEYWGTSAAPAPLIDAHIALMKHEAYVRVIDGRPLYFLGFITVPKAYERWGGVSGLRAEIERFRARAVAADAGEPYIVLAGSPKEIAGLAPMLGGDAVGAYAISDVRGIGDYPELARIAEAGWQTLARAEMPVVPTVMTGWDRRPRVENPVPWEHSQRTGAGIEYHFGTPQPE
jgi:hypothetical protein